MFCAVAGTVAWPNPLLPHATSEPGGDTKPPTATRYNTTTNTEHTEKRVHRQQQAILCCFQVTDTAPGCLWRCQGRPAGTVCCTVAKLHNYQNSTTLATARGQQIRKRVRTTAAGSTIDATRSAAPQTTVNASRIAGTRIYLSHEVADNLITSQEAWTAGLRGCIYPRSEEYSLLAVYIPLVHSSHEFWPRNLYVGATYASASR